MCILKDYCYCTTLVKRGNTSFRLRSVWTYPIVTLQMIQQEGQWAWRSTLITLLRRILLISKNDRVKHNRLYSYSYIVMWKKKQKASTPEGKPKHFVLKSLSYQIATIQHSSQIFFSTHNNSSLLLFLILYYYYFRLGNYVDNSNNYRSSIAIILYW